MKSEEISKKSEEISGSPKNVSKKSQEVRGIPRMFLILKEDPRSLKKSEEFFLSCNSVRHFFSSGCLLVLEFDFQNLNMRPIKK